MRQWLPPSLQKVSGHQVLHSAASQMLASTVDRLGGSGFATGLLQDLEVVLPAASWSVYRTGHRCKPTLFLSASRGVPDTTQDCWWAYLSGPYRSDRTWGRAFDEAPFAQPETRLCHVTAAEVQGDHRARVYEAHGVAERVSVVEHETDGSVFAVNFYRHQHQRAFSDQQIGAFESVAPVLLALTRKHLVLSHSLPLSTGVATGYGLRTRSDAAVQVVDATDASARHPTGAPVSIGGDGRAVLRMRLVRLQAGLTDRELDVCVRLLQGMTHEGIASDLGLSVPTVKTYRNRAFGRLGIHFRNELFARVLGG